MTERSWFWEGIVTGDATLAPYTSDELTDVYRLIGEFSRNRPHLLSVIGGAEDLTVSFSGTRIIVSPGYLKIDGKIFNLKNIITFDCNIAGYYRLVLRKRFTSTSSPAASPRPLTNRGV